jgi:hypothetical protein
MRELEEKSEKRNVIDEEGKEDSSKELLQTLKKVNVAIKQATN